MCVCVCLCVPTQEMASQLQSLQIQLKLQGSLANKLQVCEPQVLLQSVLLRSCVKDSVSARA